MRVGVIGGTGLYGLLDHDGDPIRVETPYGAVDLHLKRGVAAANGPTPELVFLNRHGEDHALPPHRIDPRRHIDALARCRVDAIIAVNNSGGLRPEIKAGDIVIPDDHVDLSGRDAWTFHDDEVVHVDLSIPYCPHTRNVLIAATHTHLPPDRLHESGTYVGVRGPRLETPAEVRWMATLGDVIGMTGCPEASLARERGLCYASLAFIANPAAGLGEALEADALRQALTDEAATVADIVRSAASRIPSMRDCTCRTAPERGRLDKAGRAT